MMEKIRFARQLAAQIVPLSQHLNRGPKSFMPSTRLSTASAARWAPQNRRRCWLCAAGRSTSRGTLCAHLGTNEKSSVQGAAMVNCTMTRDLDMNDTYFSHNPAHSSDKIGACLAIGQAEGRRRRRSSRRC